MRFSLSYLYMLLFILVISASCASQKKPPLSHGDSNYSQAPSSRNSGESSRSGAASASQQQRTMKRKGKKAAKQKTHDDLVKEFEDRMEANAKRRKKEAKLAEKPQYSDPSYFGHKKKPKKRPVGKRKLCKECGIVH